MQDKANGIVCQHSRAYSDCSHIYSQSQGISFGIPSFLFALTKNMYAVNSIILAALSYEKHHQIKTGTA